MVQNEPELHGFRKVVVVGSRRFSISHKKKYYHFAGSRASGVLFPGGSRGVVLGDFWAPELHKWPGTSCNSGFSVAFAQDDRRRPRMVPG